MVSVMGLDYFDGGVRVHTDHGWTPVYWDGRGEDQGAGSQKVDPFENIDNYGPTSKAGQDFLSALQAHNAAFEKQ